MRRLNIGMSVALLSLCAGPSWAASGKAIYMKHCAGCHSGMKAYAPQLGNVREWKVRIGYGRKSLIDSVKNGHDMMPVHEGLLSDKDIG